MNAGMGLRERKKQQTRQRITDAASTLFAERGFDAVRVAEVAVAADVSEATVFNYFPTKEDLFYGGMAGYERTLLDAVAARPAGTSPLQAFREFVLRPQGLLSSGGPDAVERIATAARIVADSPSLQAREHQLMDRATHRLAELLADGKQTSDIRPYVLANALIGVHRAMIHLVQQQASAGRSARAIAAKAVAEGRRALVLLEYGCTGS
jgi:AcrR family transcriptional regulator